jgi:hypothetical protein
VTPAKGPQAMLREPARQTATTRSCRLCGAPLTTSVADLGMSPLANSFIPPEHAEAMEPYYPLHAFVCGQCFLVQVGEFAAPQEIFSNYAYFSSYSDGWLKHCADYVAAIVPRLGLGAGARVVEIASNDGALLGLLQRRGLDVLGVEAAAPPARVAIEKGIPTTIGFFGRDMAVRLRDQFAAELIIVNNVLAHTPDLHDFIAGLALLLAPDGTITIEFPHLLELIEQGQFDTIYHEHFSYFSLLSAETALSRHGLAVYDVETVAVHGGSLRLFVAHAGGNRPVQPRLAALRREERAAGVATLDFYRNFAAAVVATKCDVLAFFLAARRAGRRVVGYAAAAKGNTLLNYCGIGRDFIDYVVDRNPYKQGRLMPGTHLPIYEPERVFETRPDYLFILAWNWKDEIISLMSGVRGWGGRFVVATPSLEIIA